MPLSPAWSRTKASTWRDERSLGLKASLRFGRSKLRTKVRGGASNSLSTMSPRVGASAVAVSAMVCRRPPIWRARLPSVRYSGRKSWPHCETQCASSIAIRRTSDSPSISIVSGPRQPLGCDIEQAQLALAQQAQHPRIFRRIVARVQAARDDTGRR
jgi:hypothetical protein